MPEKDEYIQIIGDVLAESPGLALGIAVAAGAYAIQAAGLPPFAVHFFGPSGAGKTCVANVLDSLEFRSVDLPFTLLDNVAGNLPRKTKLPVISFGEPAIDALVDGHCMIDGAEIKNFKWWDEERMHFLMMAARTPSSIGGRLRAFAEESVPDLRRRYEGFAGEHFARVPQLGIAMLGVVVPTWDMSAAKKYLPHLKTAPRPALRSSVYLNSDSVNFLDGRGPSLSGALNQSLERYKAILETTEMPEFSAEDLEAMAAALGKAPTPRQEELDELWLSVERGAMDFETGRVSPEIAALVKKLQKLNMAQAITLRERLEAMRRGRK